MNKNNVLQCLILTIQTRLAGLLFYLTIKKYKILALIMHLLELTIHKHCGDTEQVKSKSLIKKKADFQKLEP